MRNFISDTDMYKQTHWMQTPVGVTWMESYGEPRVGAKMPYAIADGLAYIIKNYFICPTKSDLIETIELNDSAFGKGYTNTEVWEKVIKLGYIPVRVKGLPEGTKAPIGTPHFTIEPTEEWFAKTCNAIETMLMRVWYSSSLVTRLHMFRQDLEEVFERSGTPELVDYALNDFSARSASCGEEADIAGMAFLKVFRGSDNGHAQLALNRLYKGAKGRLQSVWATEHAVALSYGPGEGEYNYVKAQLVDHTDKLKSIVIDTYDMKNFITNVITRKDVKDLILAHEGRIVFRPDSGNMYKNCEWLLEELSRIFGFSVNRKFFKVIGENVGIIQGDGIKYETGIALYEHIEEAGWSADNMVLGSGNGFMYEGLSRDTNRWAIKPDTYVIDGKTISCAKSPKTDPTKSSKGGRLKVDKNLKTWSSLTTSPQEFDAVECIMVDYYNNGDIPVWTFKAIK